MQEAKGTARALRQEVGQLQITHERMSEKPPPVESMLDALDGAIEMMSVLEAPASLALSHGKERRVRIDIVTLLLDVAPNAKLSIEPGAGTEVFGIEKELRRVLDLLVTQSGADASSPSAIDVHRDADWVVISVGLGPEGMATRDLEHRWLNRMAMRNGGRVEVTGNETRLFLPADAESGQQEIQQLRKELEQAQQLGAVYAKELAEAFAFTTGDSSLPGPVTQSVQTDEARLEIFIATSAALGRSLRQTTELLRGDVTRLARTLGDPHELVVSLLSRQVAYGELAGDLERIAKVSCAEPPRPVELGQLLTDVVNGADGRAKRQGVTVSVQAHGTFTLTTRASVMTLLVRSLVDLSLYSTPKNGSIGIVLRRDDTPEAKRYSLEISDDGPPIPEGALAGLLRGSVDPSSLGRPSALSWLTLGTSAMGLGVTVEVGGTADGRSGLRVTFG